MLEEMPPFPERESSILAKLKKKKGPGAVSGNELEDGKREGGELNGGGERSGDSSAITASNAVRRTHTPLHTLSKSRIYPSAETHTQEQCCCVGTSVGNESA